MPRERETRSQKIKFVDYNIDGNRIRAYYRGAGNMIFVLDETISADKPNVLLVLDSFDERKWDDVLANDYGIDLETIRPKKDNKYQKLDIEYGGLDVYSELIDAYESGSDLDGALENLERFRIMSVRRAATERLSIAEETAAKSRETIERTNETISELRTRLKSLRAKLSEQKHGIGREPTKSSAAKILKTEAQIDATNEKLTRAKKRLANAQRRLVIAEDDAEIARAILARHPNIKSSHRTGATKPIRVSKPAPVAAKKADVDDFDDVDDEEYSETVDYEATSDEDTADDVKPLFDTDPNILDENIAFKPIDFSANDVHQEVAKPVVAEQQDNAIAPVPLTFTPPTDLNEPRNDTFSRQENVPMLDTLTTVDMPVAENTDVETVVDTSTPDSEIRVTETVSEPMVPMTPDNNSLEIVAAEPAPMVRPVSPIAGYDGAPSDEYRAKKPTLIYYIMLIVLIALSIFTLWLYQQKNGAVVPDLAATTGATETTATNNAEPVEPNIPSPFVNPVVDNVEPVTESAPVVESEPIAESGMIESVTEETVATEVEPKPVAVVVAEPEPEPVAEPEPKPVAVDVEPVNVTVESPFVELRTVANYEPERQSVPTEEEILARKPGYNVSQNDKMFVASPDYTTETVVESTVGADAAYSMDTDVQPIAIEEIVTSEQTGTVNDVACADGALPDANGCCPDEDFVYTADGYMCCVGDDCFPPLN